MKRGAFGVAMSVCAVLALSVAGLKTQTPPSPADGVVLAEQYFKNIQALRGIPVDEFMDTMGMFAAATGMNCDGGIIPRSGCRQRISVSKPMISPVLRSS